MKLRSDEFEIDILCLSPPVTLICRDPLYMSHAFALGSDFHMGGQSGAAVTRPHGNHQDVGSNPAAARNEKTDIGQTPAQKVPQ